MPLTPGYGETPLAHEELSALLPAVVDILSEPITRADVYDLEQGLQNQLFEAPLPAARDGFCRSGSRIVPGYRIPPRRPGP